MKLTKQQVNTIVELIENMIGLHYCVNHMQYGSGSPPRAIQEYENQIDSLKEELVELD